MDQIPFVEFVGGLGDVIWTMHYTCKYTSLSALGPDEKRRVVVLSHNPASAEFFKWHPKAAQLDILTLPYTSPWGPEQRRAHGLGDEPFDTGIRQPHPIRFYPSPEDAPVLAWLASRRFIAFCLSASESHRSIPRENAETAAALAKSYGYEVMVFGRRYSPQHIHGKTKIVMQHVEVTLEGLPGVTSLIDRLSAPGTVEALRLAAGTFCTHSALCLASWFLQKPTFTMVKQDAHERDFLTKGGYAFGQDFPNSWHVLLNYFDPVAFEEFLGGVDIVCPKVTYPGGTR